MNLVIRKLSMLKTSIELKEMSANKLGYSISGYDIDLKNNIKYLLDKLENFQ